jgi:hypothetical protein
MRMASPAQAWNVRVDSEDGVRYLEASADSWREALRRVLRRAGGRRRSSARGLARIRSARFGPQSNQPNHRVGLNYWTTRSSRKKPGITALHEGARFDRARD